MADLELTVKQAATELGISERTCRDWLRSGRLRGGRVRGRRGDEWRVYAETLSNAKGSDAAEAAGRGEQDAATGGGGRGDGTAALVAEVRSLREETAAYREHLERLTDQIMGLRETIQRLLPPAVEPAQVEQTRRPWWAFWRR